MRSWHWRELGGGSKRLWIADESRDLARRLIAGDIRSVEGMDGANEWEGWMRRVIASGVAAIAALVLVAAPVAAHNEWEPETAAPGSIIDLTLFVEDEQPDAGTTTVELHFPVPITVAALPAVQGWTATLMDGELGGPATGVTWAGGPAPGDVDLPIRLGPLPSEPGRLQFKTVQTYDNGEVDRWIDDWPRRRRRAPRSRSRARPRPRRARHHPGHHGAVDYHHGANDHHHRDYDHRGRRGSVPGCGQRLPTATLCPSWSPRR